MGASIYLAIPLMLLLTVLQTAVLPLFPIFGVVPQLPVLAAFSWGLLRGPQEGIGWAFVAGLCLDLFSAGPFGAHAVALIMAVFVVAVAQMSFPQSRFVLPVVLAGLGSFIFLYAYAFLIRVGGYTFNWVLTAAFPAQAILQAFLIVPMYWLLYGLIQIVYPQRIRNTLE
jgi:rod shape-determining protein MreD